SGPRVTRGLPRYFADVDGQRNTHGPALEPGFDVRVLDRSRHRTIKEFVKVLCRPPVHGANNAFAVSRRVVIGLARGAWLVGQVRIAGNERDLVAAKGGVAHHIDLRPDRREIQIPQEVWLIDE